MRHKHLKQLIESNSLLTGDGWRRNVTCYTVRVNHHRCASCHRLNTKEQTSSSFAPFVSLNSTWKTPTTAITRPSFPPPSTLLPHAFLTLSQQQEALCVPARALPPLTPRRCTARRTTRPAEARPVHRCCVPTASASLRSEASL